MTSKGRTHSFAFASVYLMLSGPVHAHPDASRAVSIQAEQVRIKSEPGVMLAGELHVPRSGETRKPAVLLLGGGGASPHGIYPLLEARLHAKGIVTLSFDKRGVGQSTGTFDDAMEPAHRDARAALAYLRSRDDLVDKDRIAILGLSQGAVIGPALAVENPPIAAVVALAAPAGERGVMFLDAMRLKLAASGMEAKAVEHVVGATRFYLNALTTNAPRETIAGGRMALVQSFVAGGWKPDQAEGAVKTLADPATSSLYTVAASQVLSQVRAPVLAIYAADDTVVSSALSIPEARRALSKNKDATIVVMPNVEHGFKPLVSTASGKRDYQGWPISDPATLDLITEWLPHRLLQTVRGK